MNYIAKFIQIINAAIQKSLAYKTTAWTNVVVRILQIIVFYYIWMAIYGGKTELYGIKKAQIITYIILTRIIFMQVSWGANNWMNEMIKNGDISLQLLLPLDFQLYLYAIRIGNFFSFVLTASFPIVLISALLFGLTPPATFLAMLLFLISFLMALTIAFLIEFAIGLLCFYTTNGWGLQIFKESVIAFLSGAMVPIAFFKGWLKVLVDYLPFKNMVYTPVSIYLGFSLGSEAIRVIVQQLIWILGLILLTRILFHFSIRKVTIQGG